MFGYSLLGELNRPAPASLTGLEVDKLRPESVDRYIADYLRLIPGEVSSIGAKASAPISIGLDQNETGPQNWTDDFMEQFRARRGYDLLPWLPALTGAVVDGAKASDAFLWDFRRTIGELYVDSFIKTVADGAHRRGLGFVDEGFEAYRPQQGDDLDLRRLADAPQAAIWTFLPKDGPFWPLVLDQRGAASVAHAYGQRVVLAEAFTNVLDPFAFGPRDLKPIADDAFVQGINRLQDFGVRRNDTWASDAKPWIDYLARTSFMLQQGRPAADIAYFYGEDTPLVALSRERLADLPRRTSFAFINATILASLKVEHGLLATPAGGRYKALQLGGTSPMMTLGTLRAIEKLVEDGVEVFGEPPEATPSLADDRDAFRATVDRLWPRSQPSPGARRVVRSNDGDALVGIPDFQHLEPAQSACIRSARRELEHGTLVFVSNACPGRMEGETAFRDAAFTPELWDPETGLTRPVAGRVSGRQTFVTLGLDPGKSIFVMFRKPGAPAPEPAQAQAQAQATAEIVVPGPWQVSFQPGRGAPRSETFDTLQSWSSSKDAGVKYFSGRAEYSAGFDLPAVALDRDSKIQLDLGDLRDVAVVRVNGRSFGTLWFPPFRVDVTGALKRGRNTITVSVTDLWVNRMIGDAQPSNSRLYAREVDHPGRFGDVKMPPHVYMANAPLRDAGLLGPVRLLAVRRVASNPLSSCPGRC